MMKLVILAGGRRSMISADPEGIPKPMLEIGGRPILWHIMKHASMYGIHEFIICGGYKVNLIKEYFRDFYIYQSDVMIDLENNEIQILKKQTEDWKVIVADTGLCTSPAERVYKIQKYIQDEDVIVTYGDCISDLSLAELINVHMRDKNLATMAVAHPAGRKTALHLDEEGRLTAYEKGSEAGTNAWTSAGLFIINKKVFKDLNVNNGLEDALITLLAEKRELAVYRHNGFWRSVETARDKLEVQKLWELGKGSWVDAV